MKVVTRFAPSPTGHLHIGGARTAIFCWLLSRHYKGKFFLRIEDTDTERSKQEYTDSILASMSWLGLDWDGEEIYQTERFDLYNEYIDKLLDTGHAYWCECSPEEVESMREKARAEGKKPKYNGKCRERKLGPGEGRVVRFKAPLAGPITFDDMVKGPIMIDASELDDMVLRRADGAPTYNLAVVVDDLTTGITHVIRGDDHVNNTPRQILLYKALGEKLPIFGHTPMILGPDRQKLSKRHGARSVIEYEEDGLLPEALVNYLARLGWSHGDQEIFFMQELVEFFDGKNMNASAAAFDPDKLNWVNAQHLRSKTPEELLPSLKPFIEKLGFENLADEKVKDLIPLFQSRANLLDELAEQMSPLLQRADNIEYDEKAADKRLNDEGKGHITALKAKFEQLYATNNDPAESELNELVQAYVKDNGLKFGQVGPALRVALLGFQGGPDLSAVMKALGKDELLARLARAERY